MCGHPLLCPPPVSVPPSSSLVGQPAFVQYVARRLLDKSALVGIPFSARDPSAVPKGLEADRFGPYLYKVVSESFARLTFRMLPFDSECWNRLDVAANLHMSPKTIRIIDARRLAHTNGRGSSEILMGGLFTSYCPGVSSLIIRGHP